jgi:hypothetical protein
MQHPKSEYTHQLPQRKIQLPLLLLLVGQKQSLPEETE